MIKKISLESIKNIENRRSGLSADQVSHQLRLHGPNEILEVSGNLFKEIALDTIKDPMIWFLTIIGLIFIALGERTDAIVLLGSILPLVLMDAFLHWRTRSSTVVLRGNLSTEATVLRNGQQVKINSRDIVPGDHVILNSNEFVPADGIFIKEFSLQVDESALTGESLPISKQAYQEDLSGRAELRIDETTLGLAGTRTLSGHGVLLVLETGEHTEYAQIVQSVSSVPHERTPLQISISRLVGVLLWAAGIFCLVLAGVLYYQGKGLMDAFLSAAILAVAAIPEEFPVVFTFFLGVGVYRLAKKQVLVRRAVSVENIGRINRICTDKTGTITVGKLKLTHVLPVSSDVNEDMIIGSALNAASSKDFDPVDSAVGELATERGIKGETKIKIFPFTEDRKRESCFVVEGKGIVCHTKGAPETIFSIVNLSPGELKLWRSEVSRLAREGHKVLACAWKKVPDETEAEPVSGLNFFGLLAFEDPPRPEVLVAMDYCRANNIKVTMITGDHPETALAIAREVRLAPEPLNVISVEDCPEKFEDEWLQKDPQFLLNTNVIARCRPIQKLRIVRALKATGELVAVTGDGVNDVPALKMGDISIAMGARGTRSAKEVSQMILMDDNFSTIVNAVVEGKLLFHNMKKSFEYLVLFHVPFVLSAAIIPLMGYPLLYLPVQIVWLELIIHPTALFAFQGDGDQKGEIISGTSFFSRKELLKLLFIGTAFTLVVILNYVYALREISDLGHARARIMWMLCLWSISLIISLGNLRSMAPRLICCLTLGLSVVLIQVPSVSTILHLTPIHFPDWLVLVPSVLVFAVIVKLIART